MGTNQLVEQVVVVQQAEINKTTGVKYQAFFTEGGAQLPVGDSSWLSVSNAPSGSLIAASHNFASDPNGVVDQRKTNGPGLTGGVWLDARTEAEGGPLEEFLEEARVVSGVLRHRGTALVAALSMEVLAANSRSITAGYVDPTTLDEGVDTYASTRLSFVDSGDGNGYVAYIQEDDPDDDHEFVIVRDTNGVPTVIAGPWDINRRLEETDVWSFRHDGSRFAILVNGEELGSVVDETWDIQDLVFAGIVLNSQGTRLPGIPWWMLSVHGREAHAVSSIYEPESNSNWTSVHPENVQEALDALASRVTALEEA